jgi:hypothetical protein
MTLSSSTITSPAHILATSLPLAAPTDTTIPMPTVTFTPSTCGATTTDYQIVTIDTGTNSTPAWVASPTLIHTTDVTLNGTYSMKSTFTFIESGFLKASPTINAPSATFSQKLRDCTLTSVTTTTVTWNSFYYLDNILVNKATPVYGYTT